MIEYGQTVKYQKRVKSGNQKYKESRKHGSSAFMRHSSVSTFVLSPQIGLQNQCSDQASSSWTQWRLRPPTFSRLPTMVDPGPPWPSRLVEEALGTGSIRAELTAILAAHFRTVCEDGASLLAEKRSGQGIHSFL